MTERLEVISTSLEQARAFVTKRLEKFGTLDEQLPNFDANYKLLQTWAGKGHTLRKDMPRIPNRQVKDFQKALEKGRFDLHKPFAKSTDQNNLFPDGLTGDRAKEFIKAGKHDGNKTDDKIKTSMESISAGKLIPIQQQIYLDAAFGDKITTHGVEGFLKIAKKTKLIASKDGYLIDGHHRTATSILIDPKLKLNVLVVDMPITDLLKLSRAYGAARGNKPNESTLLSFKQFINESKSLTVFHGDNFNTKKLDISLMNNGNNQEGIGIYFGDLKTAETYGKNIVKAEIIPNKFIYSRDRLGKFLSSKQISQILLDMNKINSEEFWYMATDYGVEAAEETDIKKQDFDFVARQLVDEQVRNFQVDLANRFGVEPFVKSWLSHTRYDGTFEKSSNFYAIMNTKIKLSPVTNI